jgi:DNA invertase Pin-like site-specific DNA recombinase
VRFHSFNEPFLDTTGPFAGFLIPLFAWLAQQESIHKGKPLSWAWKGRRRRARPWAAPSWWIRRMASLW